MNLNCDVLGNISQFLKNEDLMYFTQVCEKWRSLFDPLQEVNPSWRGSFDFLNGGEAPLRESFDPTCINRKYLYCCPVHEIDCLEDIYFYRKCQIDELDEWVHINYPLIIDEYCDCTCWENFYPVMECTVKYRGEYHYVFDNYEYNNYFYILNSFFMGLTWAEARLQRIN